MCLLAEEGGDVTADNSLFDDAADAIADWINGAPCDDPAYARSLVNRLSTLQPPEDTKDEPCPDCWQLVAEKQELRDKLRDAYFVVADRQQQVENDERNMRAARRHIELFVENGERAALTAALAGLDPGVGSADCGVGPLDEYRGQ